MYYNLFFPLPELIETKTYPYARTFRTSFIQKLRDTYKALAGELSLLAGELPLLVPSNKPHVGIFDYLTAFIPAGLLLLSFWLMSDLTPLNTILMPLLSILAVVINGPMLIARVAFGAIATLMLSPIVLIAHGISLLARGNIHTDALNIRGQMMHDDRTLSLGDYLQLRHMDIEELSIEVIRFEAITPTEIKKAKNQNSYDKIYYQLICGNKSHSDLRNERLMLFLEETPNTRALFKLNVGNIVNNVEKHREEEKQTILELFN